MTLFRDSYKKFKDKYKEARRRRMLRQGIVPAIALGRRISEFAGRFFSFRLSLSIQ